MSDMDDLCFRLRNAKVVEPKMPSENYSTTLGKQAAELIEELERRWIPVSERLPEYDVMILCFCRIYGCFMGVYSRIADDVDAGVWSDFEESGVLPPTHWMLLPEGPEEE